MSTNYVKSGLWSDYSQAGLNRHQFLVTDSLSRFITNALAVAITSTGSPLLKLFKHPLNILRKKAFPSSSGSPPASDESEAEAEELRDSSLRILYRGAMRRIARRHIRRGYLLVAHNTPTASLPTATNRPNGPVGFCVLALIVLTVFGLSVLLLIASIVSAGLATGKLAISLDPSCGDYQFKFNSRTSLEPFIVYNRQAESQAAEYAQKCYGPTSIATDCNKFYSQNITYTKNGSASCPFDGDVCEGGKNEAFRITTGLISGAFLGMNAVNPYLFERSTTCAPMVRGKNYVRVGVSDRGEKQWEYWYGRTVADYTWANPVAKSSWAIKGYSMGVECYEPADSKNDFNALPGFRAGPYPVALMFISSHDLLYPQYRTDPVFPAHQKAKFPPEYKGPTLYFNNSTRAGVLGCVDEYRICKTQSGPCWTNKNITSIPGPQNRDATEEENVATLLKLALDFSTSCGSVQYRQAEALDAQAKIADTQSLPLAPKQWQVEAEKIFQTSLARMQSNIYNIVRGTSANHDGYHDILDPNFRGICELVKIPTPGQTNINFWGAIGTVAAVVFVWVMPVRRKVSSGDEVMKVMVAVLLWDRVLLPILQGMATAAVWSWEHSKPLRDGIEDYILKPLSKMLKACLDCW